MNPRDEYESLAAIELDKLLDSPWTYEHTGGGVMCWILTTASVEIYLGDHVPDGMQFGASVSAGDGATEYGLYFTDAVDVREWAKCLQRVCTDAWDPLWDRVRHLQAELSLLGERHIAMARVSSWDEPFAEIAGELTSALAGLLRACARFWDACHGDNPPAELPGELDELLCNVAQLVREHRGEAK